MKYDRFDIVFACSLRLSADASEAVATEITAAARVGFRVGLRLLSERGGRGRPELPRELRESTRRWSVQMVEAGTKVDCELLIVHPDGTSLAVILSEVASVGFGQAVIVVRDPPHVSDVGRERLIEGFAGSRRGRVWIAPVGPGIRSHLETSFADLQLTFEDWHPLVDLQLWPARTPRGFSDSIVVGRHDLGPGSWPSAGSDILAAYPDDPRFEIRVLGGATDALRTLKKLPSNWRLSLPGAGQRRAFLSELDAYVYFPWEAQVEPLGGNLLEAMATALPIILPPVFAPLFGDAAIYAVPQDVASLLLELRGSESVIRHRSVLARFAVEDFFADDRFATRLKYLFRLTPRPGARKRATPALTRKRNAVADPVEEVAIQFGARLEPPAPVDPDPSKESAVDPLGRRESDLAMPADFVLPPHDLTGFLAESDEPVFSADLYIAALARSGSTLLGNVLTIPPAYWIMHEPWFMQGATAHQLYQQALSFGWQLTEKEWALPTRLRNKETMLRRYRDLLAPRLVELRKWGAKETRPQFHAQTIATLRPKQIIVLTRDIGEAYLSSMEAHRRRDMRRHSERWTYKYFSLAARELVSLVDRLGEGDCLRIVRYDEMRSARSRSELSDWLDWPMTGDPTRNLDLLSRDYEIERHRSGRVSQPLGAEARGLPVFLDDWADQLRRACQSYQQRFGF